MKTNNKKETIFKIVLVLLLTIIFLSIIGGAIFAENKKEIIIQQPEIQGVEKNNKIYKVFDVSNLRAKIKEENPEISVEELLGKLKVRAERTIEGEDKVLVTEDATKKIDGEDGIVKFSLEDGKTYLIENTEKTTQSILLDYKLAMQDSQKVFAKPMPGVEKIPLKKTGVNNNIFVQIIEFLKLIFA